MNNNAVSSYITPEGLKRFQEELSFLWKIKRPQVTQAVGEAAAMGDRSENAEYIYGKRQLRQIDSRIYRHSVSAIRYTSHFLLSTKSLDHHKHIVYDNYVIQSFTSSETEHFFATGKSRRLPQDILKRAAMRLTQLDGATCLDDLRLPPSNRLEDLAHDRTGQCSIRINDQWRVCFRFDKGDAYDVEIVDYH